MHVSLPLDHFTTGEVGGSSFWCQETGYQQMIMSGCSMRSFSDIYGGSPLSDIVHASYNTHETL